MCRPERPMADLTVCNSPLVGKGPDPLIESGRMLETDMEHLFETEQPMELVIAKADGAALLRVDLRGRQKVTLGRSRKCDVRLTGPGISRHHAIIFEEAGRWMLLDTSARNGVWNGQERIKIAILSSDRPLRVGEAYLWTFGCNEGALTPPRLTPYPAPAIALRAEYIEALWRSRTLQPVHPPATRAVA